MTLTDEQWGEFQTTLATRSPVLVIGSGCHRVGYDKGPAWDEVVRRVALVWSEIETMKLFKDAPEQPRIFFDYLWLSKLSQETISGYHSFAQGEMPAGQDIRRPTPEKWTDVDRARTALAASLFGVLFETTRCLGNVIVTGTSPVTHWRSVSNPGPFGSGIPGEDDDADEDHAEQELPADDARDAQLARELATAHMRAVVDIASYLDRLRSGDSPDDGDNDLREEHRLDFGPSTELGAKLTLLKLGAILRTTDYLLSRFFHETAGHRLTGALVEWLADLFWHLMVTDSRVPPSQAEVAFYLNLRESPDGEGYAARVFTRARQGEALSPMTSDAVTGDVREMLCTYDSGKQRWSDASVARIDLTRTMSASLIELWRKRKTGQPPVVALVHDYDLSCERMLLEFLETGEAIHVVVPVWRRERKSGSYFLDWMFGTIERSDGRVTPTQLTRLQNWRWYGDQPPSGDEDDPVRGPILVKLNGSPLLDLEDRPESLDLRKDEDIKLATVFTEHDSLQAILSFADAGGDGKPSLAADVIDALDWRLRSWVFLGDSFPDWLPRVRLLFNAQLARKSSPAEGHIAIDRRFDWPEVGLLRTLGVQPLHEDLASIAGYHRRDTRARDNPDVATFLGDVCNALAAHTQKNS